MSLDDDARPTSPVGSSGRDSPVQRPTRRYQAEEEPRRQDKSYRRYASGIERALGSFDGTRLEWPDYISFLGRLLKAIQSHPPAVESLPHQSTLAARLAQCLNPSLPSGVHQKALDVYAYIFALIGKDALAQGLHIYLPGLSSVLIFASLTLRPSFLSLIETHIVTLKAEALRPALKSLLLCLLPGLEDETSEEFDQTLAIIDKLQEASLNVSNGFESGQRGSPAFFWQCLFLASIGSASRRAGALAFLSKRLPKLYASALDEKGDSTELSNDAQAVITPEPGLLIRCFASGLRDEQMLLQRGFLDLLLSHLPLHSPVLCSMAEKSDLEMLVGAAISVVARRDMSLNRRLWSWILGPNDTSSADDRVDDEASTNLPPTSQENGVRLDYFLVYGNEPLINSVRAMFKRKRQHAGDYARPFRMCLSLMDRVEIGGQIVPAIFVDAMTDLYQYKQSATTEDYQDVLRSASSFFDGIESGIIWSQILHMFSRSVHTSPELQRQAIQELDLARFVIESFNIHEDEVLSIHIPLIALFGMLGAMKTGVEEISDALLQLVELMVRFLPDGRAGERSSIALSSSGPSEIVESIHNYYKDYYGNPEVKAPPYSTDDAVALLLKASSQVFLSTLEVQKASEQSQVPARIFSTLLARSVRTDTGNVREVIVSSCIQAIQSATQDGMEEHALPFTRLASIAQIFIQIVASGSILDVEKKRTLVVLLVEQLSRFLDPTNPKYNLEAVRCIWQLDEIEPEQSLVEANVAQSLAVDKMAKDKAGPALDAAMRFGILWNLTIHFQSSREKRVTSGHTRTFSDRDLSAIGTDYHKRLQRPLLLLLDALRNPRTEVAQYVTSWLANLPSFGLIIDFLIAQIEDTRVVTLEPSLQQYAEAYQVQAEHRNSLLINLYFFEHLLRTLTSVDGQETSFLTSAANLRPGPGPLQSSHGSSPTQRQAAISKLCLDALQNVQEYPKGWDAHVHQLQQNAVSILQYLLKQTGLIDMKEPPIDDTLIELLRHNVHSESTANTLQIALLEACSLALRQRLNPSYLESTLGAKMQHMDASRLSSKPSTPVNPVEPRLARHPLAPPANLVKCIQEGISHCEHAYLTESWMAFLAEVLPLFGDTLFHNLIPLVETLCRRIRDAFTHMRSVYQSNVSKNAVTDEPAMIAMLGGLEFMLNLAHSRLASTEQATPAVKSIEPTSGFFGNVVSGVFSSDAHKSKHSAANTRLTVILCFQDALRVGLSIWQWGSYGNEVQSFDSSCAVSFNYVSQRLRGRARRLIDFMFLLEPLECLEALIASTTHKPLDSEQRTTSFIHLLHVLDSTRPKATMPTLFNAIYSRNSPTSLDPARMSTLTSELQDTVLGDFLVSYMQSLDDDAMDEVWNDCMVFLRDVLANPLPHHRIFPSLLVFLVVLAEKIERTNFGEQRKMRKDISVSST